MDYTEDTATMFIVTPNGFGGKRLIFGCHFLTKIVSFQSYLATDCTDWIIAARNKLINQRNGYQLNWG